MISPYGANHLRLCQDQFCVDIIFLPAMIIGMTGMELLAEIRRRGLTQGEFAWRLGYRQETISRWVRGHKPIPKTIEYLLQGGFDKLPRRLANGGEG